ncbi:hypothetical protein QE152_g12932 [Popillia japonica]|uniref:PWWP domain-containing protein n=1 Tax=Popillia japonica TaxID=7064 RepID=A0AAW1LBD5_POPJA
MDTWTVVKFKDENSVEAVPSDWILDNQCYWPPYTADKIKSSIIKHEAPSSSWSLFNIEVFRNSTFDNYLQARKKSRKAEVTSDLSSDDGAETIKRKVHKRRKSFHSSSESEEYLTLEEPPRVSVTKNIGVHTAVTSDSNTASSDNTDCTCCGIQKLAKIKILQTKQLTTTVDEGVSLYNIFHFSLKNENELLEVEYSTSNILP